MIGFSPGRVHKEYETVFRLVNGFNANNQTSQSQQSQQQAKVQLGLEQAYQVLDLPTAADLKSVKTAYRRLVARYHPDRLGPDANANQHQYAQQRMIEIREAFELLEEHLS